MNKNALYYLTHELCLHDSMQPIPLSIPEYIYTCMWGVFLFHNNV